ncbi:SRPBCC family protein [Chitinimonas sp. BJYL2]|uniref:SRPBCC family protein n=1 Tax=Chitinimonas sp. BJYL2 TaxID=2976696 RepID=UPI0022B50595|nr:SRPBCC family protein [Chitinimonas sp. BJYL2]
MHFEHLVQINNPDDPLLTVMSRAQLWRGLMRRVEKPEEFLVGVESVRIIERGEDWLKREMQLGALLVQDHILLAHEHIIQFATAPSAQHGGGHFTMVIEEPSPGDLFVRFRYETSLPEAGEATTEADDAYFADYVKSAYRATDIDAIRWIRELLETGQLD